MTVFEHQDISKSEKAENVYSKIWLNMTITCIHVHLCVCIYTFFFYKTGMMQFNAVYVLQLFMDFEASCLLLLFQYFCFLNFLE